LVLAALAGLAAGCGGDPPPPATDPATVRRVEEDADRTKHGGGEAPNRAAAKDR
jgi:hypothetical protein